MTAEESAEGGSGGGVELGAVDEEDVEGENESWEHPGGSRGKRSLAERRAARCNTSCFMSVSPLASPGSRYLAKPPDLSPTALLDSSIRLPNSQGFPFPTTGTIQLPPLGHESLVSSPVTVDADKDNYEDADSFFMLKPQINPVSNSCVQNSEDQAMGQIQMAFVDQVSFPKQDLKRHTIEWPADIERSDYTTAEGKFVADTRCHLISVQTHHFDELLNGEDGPSQKLLEGDHMGEFYATGIGRPSEDGYNWRKYGQKQVKGSEYPRSYYKCTHPSCLVKKKVERSLDGQITKIIYEGSHNHQKSQPTRRSIFGSPYSLNEASVSAMDPESSASIEGGLIWRGSQLGSKDNSSVYWRVDGLERTSLTSIVTELSDHQSAAQVKQSNMFIDNPELSSTPASQNDDDDDDNTMGSMSFEDDGDDKSESKRRKHEDCLIETNPASHAVREPRVVVETVSEVDILNDGYRWRKYGQKVVKGNPNPRSYYKCTNPGCYVRKHLERASHDLNSVITTYKGKHNHEVPVARISNHMSCWGYPQSTSAVRTSMVLPRSISVSKGEPHGPFLVPRFHRGLELSDNYLKSGYVGSFTTDPKIEPPSCYEMNLPNLQPVPYNTLGLNRSNIDAHHAIPIANIIQDFPNPFSMGHERLAMAGYDFNHERSIGPELQSFLGQHPKENVMSFIRLPKQEE